MNGKISKLKLIANSELKHTGCISASTGNEILHCLDTLEIVQEYVAELKQKPSHTMVNVIDATILKLYTKWTNEPDYIQPHCVGCKYSINYPECPMQDDSAELAYSGTEITACSKRKSKV